MALDPRQSTTGRFGGTASDVAIYGDQASIELTIIYRFSPQILELVKHINDCLPTEDFGDAWGVDLRAARSLAAAGPRPALVDSGRFGGEVTTALYFSKAALSSTPRVALAIVDGSRAEEFLSR